MSGSFLRQIRASRQLHWLLDKNTNINLPWVYPALHPIRAISQAPSPTSSHSLHTVPPRWRQQSKRPSEPPPTDFASLDVLADAPVPATSIDVCLYDGFQLNSGARIANGDGVLLVSGEAFRWRPWVAKGSRTLVNSRGQWEVPAEAFGVFALLRQRPDLLILGIGPQMLPLSPETRKHISALGMRVEVLNTRNAASQFNMLATERGVDDVAAALIPIGWKDGVGAE